MAEYLDNPRKAPRVRHRCHATVAAGAVAFEAQTEDVGPHGCQLVAPRPLARGAPLAVVLRAEEGPAPLHVAGAVAWASAHAPWRIGVAFEEAARLAAGRFFDGLVRSRPGLADWQGVPDRISLDAMVWLAPPPRLVVDFTADEVAVLRAVGSGATVFELRSRLRDRWTVAHRALFSLLTGRHVTLSRGGAVPFANWSTLLHELEAELAVGSMGEPPEAPLPPPPRPAAPPPQAGQPPAGRPAAPTTGRYAPTRSPTSGPSFAGNDGSAGLDMDPGMLELDEAPRHAPGPRRPAEAEEAFRQALAELAEGRHVSALSLLRRALALAPGDLEIARKVGEVASGQPGPSGQRTRS